MLTCQGLIVIPQNPQLKEFITDKGDAFFSFHFATFDDRTEKHHQFQGNLWVAANEIDKWRKRLIPNKVFLLKYAEVSAEYKEADKVPFVQIKMVSRNLVPLKLYYDKDK